MTQPLILSKVRQKEQKGLTITIFKLKIALKKLWTWGACIFLLLFPTGFKNHAKPLGCFYLELS